MPKVVLLDEPDATLHPSMVRSLLTLVKEILVDRVGIKVIVTTHSPTTVALAPDDSLYVMHRGDGSTRLQKTTRDRALNELLVGVPTLSVEVENRRPVITESPNDNRYYSSIFAILKGRIDSELTPEFISAGGKELPDGSAAVVELVKKLRDNGNNHVWGLIDRDRRSVQPHPNVFFNSERYAIENLVLDPLSVGLLLLTDVNPVVAAAMSPTTIRTFDAATHGQQLIDLVLDKMHDAADDVTLQVIDYVGGFTFQVQKFALELQGHEYEEHRVTAAFPALKAYQSKLLDQVISKVWSVREEVIPDSVLKALARLVN